MYAGAHLVILLSLYSLSLSLLPPPPSFSPSVILLSIPSLSPLSFSLSLSLTHTLYSRQHMDNYMCIFQYIVMEHCVIIFIVPFPPLGSSRADSS